MAKELPYFQFEPAEYLTKDISFCSLTAQGLFINICAYYWQRNCEITKTQILRRLNYPKELEELINEGVIDLDGNFIVIKFLNDQKAKIVETSRKNKANGGKGGRPPKPKQNPKITDPLNLAKPNESQTKGIREDKIKEDEIKENNINNNNFVKNCLSDSQWLEITAMQNKIKIDVIKLFLTTFENHLITMEEQKKTLKDFKSHFIHWLNKQNLSQFKIKKVGKTNQI